MSSNSTVKKTERSSREKKAGRFFGKIASFLFITCCRSFNSREVRVAKSTPQQEHDYYKYEQVAPSGMSLQTENFLRGNLIRKTLEKSPEKILSIVNDFHKISHDPGYFLAAADICRYFSEKKDRDAIAFHLGAYRYCCMNFFYMNEAEKNSGKPFEHYYSLLPGIQILNEAIAGIFNYLKRKRLLDSSSFSLRSIDGIEFVFEAPVFRLSVPREAVSDFSLCSSYTVKSLRLLNRHSGMGVPLVAKVTSQKLSRSLRTPRGLTIPVTLFIRARVESPTRIHLFPCYQDTSLSEKITLSKVFFGEEEQPLATDFSTPLACFMNNIEQRNLLSTMLKPVHYDKQAGLCMVEPYNPAKIPVVFIHGLMSSPETWGQMINVLKYDPVIRQKYQFWFYSYSTGVPVVYSAGKLKQELLAAKEEFCTTPEATRNFEKMVLAGHSMGGLITRLLMLRNPHEMLEKICRRPWEDIQSVLLPEESDFMNRFCCFEPLPFVKRVIFMAVPHKGSAMAQKQIAKLGIRLIKLPQTLMGKKDILVQMWKKLMPGEKQFWRKDSFVTGIDNLNPKSLFVRWSGDAPLREDVPYHCIIGNHKQPGVPGGNDGVVPYSSSHLNHVESECIVKSNHSVHRNPEAIREVLRILLLHLQETSAQDLPRDIGGEEGGETSRFL